MSGTGPEIHGADGIGSDEHRSRGETDRRQSRPFLRDPHRSGRVRRG